MQQARPPRFDPTVIGWRLGRSHAPHGIELWCRYDRTAGVFGEQGSGKTLDVLAPALLAHTGAALATLTKVDDLLLTAGRRQQPQTLVCRCDRSQCSIHSARPRNSGLI
jgi:hypothetical protein